MIGDLVLWLRTALRQLVCLHAYSGRRTAYGAFTWQECDRCGRTHGWSINR